MDEIEKPSCEGGTVERPSSDEWLRTEYDALNTAGASVQESFFKLAQMSFVLNPALAVGYAFILAEDKFGKKFGFVAFPVALIALIYNIGAIMSYFDLQKKMALLYRRLLQIEKISRSRLRYYFSQSCPIFFQERHAGVANLDVGKIQRYFNVHWLTVLFFAFLIAGWGYAAAREFPWKEIVENLKLIFGH